MHHGRLIATSGIWEMVMLTLCLRNAAGALYVHGTLDRHPRAAWILVTAIGSSKAALFMLAIV